MAQTTFRYGIDVLDYSSALKIARDEVIGIITDEAKEKVNASCKYVQEIAANDKAVYGINTGFGKLCTAKISQQDTQKLQENLLKSHSVGTGESINLESAKLMMILKVHSLCQGFSGVKLETLERICWHINNNYIPQVPSQGSLGASGDLAPLAHLFLPLLGLGKLAFFNPTKNEAPNFESSENILKQNNLTSLELGPKEGLALINGTQFIAAITVQVAEKLQNCLEHADLIGAMSLEALLGSVQPFDSRLHQLRPHQGAQIVAANLQTLLKNSGFIESHKDCGRVQDPYSLRCMPQVHGASRDAHSHLVEKLNCELNSVTDNPVIFGSGDTISGGNFHGQPMALPIDYAALAASELGNISDRRTYMLMEGHAGLPTFLIENAGLDTGFMIAQYTSAALASENKTLCFPASADSIPTSLGQEDHVSMGSIGSRKALEIVNNLEKILAIEILCAAQAFEFRRPLKSSSRLEECITLYREHVPFITEDCVLSEYIEKSRLIIQKKTLNKSTVKA